MLLSGRKIFVYALLAGIPFFDKFFCPFSAFSIANGPLAASYFHLGCGAA
jgi:hypothetical protein